MSFLQHNCDPQFQAWNYFLLQNWWLNAKPCKFSTYLFFYNSEMMKSWHPSLPSFNPFVIVFYFLSRRLAKRAAPVEKTNDYDYDEAAYADPNAQRYGPPPPAIEYVQLFSWSVVASILNCFYRISVKKPNRKNLSRAIYTRLWTLLSENMHQN